MLSFVYTKKFTKQLDKQPPAVKKQFIRRLRLFAENESHPLLNIHKLSGKLRDVRSFNVSGDIRVWYTKKDTTVIVLLSIGTHSTLY
jgi:addiction module RelE/StbE family toxin